jgi:hypothetical protein
VYIGEAHPTDLWQVPNNLRDKVLHASPASLDERTALAELCVTRLSIELPAVVDDFDDTTDTNYTAGPSGSIWSIARAASLTRAGPVRSASSRRSSKPRSGA